MNKFILPLFLFAYGLTAQAKPLTTFPLSITDAPFYHYNLRVGVQEPEGKPIGDILYLEGLGDRLDNHGPLFDAWVAAGFRVISFDYPSQGETTGTPLTYQTFFDLARLAQAVELKTLEDPSRPLLVAGWSTGGLLAVRMVQTERSPRLSRPIAGMILFAPGISVYSIVGTFSLRYPLGEIKNETLTHDPTPPHTGPASPKSPGSVFWFALNLKINSILSRHEAFPKSLPTLVLTGAGDGDAYADSAKLVRWVENQVKDNGADIRTSLFPGARHELDNETARFGGPEVRAQAARFATEIVTSLTTPTIEN